MTIESAYLRAEDVAELLQISRSSVFRLAKNDKTMPALRLNGIVRFPRARLLVWLRQREQGSTARPRSLKAIGSATVGHVDGHTGEVGEASVSGDGL
jgi:excisionase family DNA binding protein